MQMPKSSNQGIPGQFNPRNASMGDEGLDYLKIATIYAASPPAESDTVLVNGSSGGSGERNEIPKEWEMIVQYDIFWNLMHSSRDLRPVNLKPAGNVVGAGLSAFVGRFAPGAVATTNMIANMGNSLFSDVLNSRTNEGTFWNT